MNLNELRTFLTIIETGSLIRASEVLNVTQSTVTARLKSLEDQLGQTLVNRNKTGATLTAAGVRLQRYADTITDLWRQARYETALPDRLQSVVTIACETDLWQGLGDRLFSFLHSDRPRIAMTVWQGSHSDVTRWLTDGKSDIALTQRVQNHPRHDNLQLDGDDLVLVATSPDAPLRYNPTYVYIEYGDAFGRDHAEAYADASTARISFGNVGLGLEHILAHGGSAYLPRRVAAPFIARGNLHPINGPVFHRPVFLVWDKAARRNWDWFDDALDRLKSTPATIPPV